MTTLNTYGSPDPPRFTTAKSPARARSNRARTRPTQWTLAVIVGLFLGFTKTGVAGMNILVVPLMATILPARKSVGALLPMLIVGDILAAAASIRMMLS